MVFEEFFFLGKSPVVDFELNTISKMNKFYYNIAIGVNSLRIFCGF